MAANPRRQLPSVDALLGRAEDLTAQHGRSPTLAALRAALAEARDAGEPRAPELLLARAAELLDRPPNLRPVLNATGVIVHTNLGRAPLATAALERVRAVASGYSNLEYDLGAGARGSRHTHLGDILAELTGAETGMAVNNNAAAVLLCLAALAEGREVVISRGELIEIGDGFRIPDILSQSGARLVEVGTTNRTSLRDFEAAIGPDTAALVRVHQSNYRIVGFTAPPGSTSSRPSPPGTGALHRRPRLGALLDLPAWPTSRRRAVAAPGVDGHLQRRQAARRAAGRHHRWLDEAIGAAPPSAGPGAAHRQAQPGGARRHARLYLDPRGRSASARAGAGLGDSRGRARTRHAAARAGRRGGRRGGARRRRRAAGGRAGQRRVRARRRRRARRPARRDPPVVGYVHDDRLLLDCRTPHDDESPSPCARSPPLTLGTAGHIDHGKTALVTRLTGTNTDRLREERERGISIELGYAELELPGGQRLSVVDVPGHERFVRTMVAGATGIDLFLLVVAADDGVMPQTIEHLAVIELLGVARGVVALTKTDLVDDELLEMAPARRRELLAETPYAAAPIVAVSARDGSGLPELLAALDVAAAGATDRAAAGRAAAGRPRLHPEGHRHGGHGHAVAGRRAGGDRA